MARIRIVDEWLRSPVSSPARHRAIMVVARTWSEQRVLMRAFAASEDQTRPTIHLQGEELAIGPAGTDPHGEWGIHVEPPVDGKAQELREALQQAARRIAGSKGNPPRLEDEVPEFDEKATHNWSPGTPRDLPKDGKKTTMGHDGGQDAGYYEPAAVAPMSQSPVIPSAASSASTPSSSSTRLANGRPDLRRTPPMWGRQYDEPELEDDRDRERLEVGMSSVAAVAATSRRAKRRTIRASGAVAVQRSPMLGASPSAASAVEPVPAPQSQALSSTDDAAPVASPGAAKKGVKTVHGFLAHGEASEEMPLLDAAGPAPTIARAPKKAESFAQVASKTMPLGLNLDKGERAVLNALGQRDQLTAAEIGELIDGAADPIEWMSALMDKLSGCGLELVVPGEDRDGEPTYVLAH